MCVCVHSTSEETRLRELRGRQGSKTAYIRNTIHLVFPPDRGNRGNTRIFKENIRGRRKKDALGRKG